MNRLLALAAALLVSLPTLAVPADAAAQKPGAPAAHGKPQAPVTISATLAADRAAVTVRFHSPATDVGIEVHGVDGLVVTSDATPLSGGRFARGETAKLDVAFTEGAEPGQLTVVVTGTFSGAKRMASTGFVTRPPTPEQLKAGRNAATDASGRRIKLMPVETR